MNTKCFFDTICNMNQNGQTLSTAQTKGRNNVLDVAKGIGIFLVIFAHINYTPELLIWIYSFHMPLFFFISGMLFNRDRYSSFGGYLKRRMKNMICPYLFFSIVPMAVVFVLDCIPFLPVNKPISEYYHGFLQVFIAYGSASVFNTPLWFVTCLFAVEIMYWHISKLPKLWNAVICFLLAGLGWLLESNYVNLSFQWPWSLDSALFALSYFMTGNLVAPWFTREMEKCKDGKQKLLCGALIAVLMVISVPLAMCNGKVSMGSKILQNGFLFYITGILGSVLVLAISTLLERSRFLKYLGQNTFCIMGVHVMFRNYFLYPVCNILNMDYDQKVFGETILPFFVILILSLVTVEVYRYLQSKIKSLGKTI